MDKILVNNLGLCYFIYTKQHKVPEVFTGRENREAGAKPARDRRRNGLVLIDMYSHCAVCMGRRKIETMTPKPEDLPFVRILLAALKNAGICKAEPVQRTDKTFAR